MRAPLKSLLLIAAGTLIVAAGTGTAVAQKKYHDRGKPSYDRSPPRGDHGRGNRPRYRNPGWGVVVPGLIMAVPALTAPHREEFIDDDLEFEDRPPQRPRRPQQQRARRQGPSGAPPAGETRLVPDEVVIELPNTMRPQQIDALQRRHRLTRLESTSFQLTGTTLYRWRIPDRRAVATVVRALEGDTTVSSAQPNYRFTLQQEGTRTPAGDAAQFKLAKLRLPEAHALARGSGVRVAVIDSAVDIQNPELDGSIAGTFDTLTVPMTPHKHGTAMAGVIAAHGKLLGAAPDAKILAVRAFNPDGRSADGTTFNILKGLDWAVANRARVINMSFAGPNDPAIRRSLAAANKKGVVLIAAAGNAGAKSPPLYPAADPNVIAVTATDAEDRLFEKSNRGRHIALAAPGDQILVAIPGGYEVASGTSYAAAAVSGIAALMLQRDPTLTPSRLRQVLQTTAKDLGPKGRDQLFGFGLADAYGALGGETAPIAAVPLPVERASTGAR